MNYLQIEINVDYHRERLLHEAETERMANHLRSPSVTEEPKKQQRRALASFWRRAATQTA